MKSKSIIIIIVAAVIIVGGAFALSMDSSTMSEISFQNEDDVTSESKNVVIELNENFGISGGP